MPTQYPTIIRVAQKAGRSYRVDGNGAADVSAKYQLVLDRPLGLNELPTTFSGVPAIYSAHPDRPGYYALYYTVEQPADKAKCTLDVTVHYGPAELTVESGVVTESVTQWGWDDATGEKELTVTADDPPVPVVNSAGDPFDTVPTVSVPTPVFTKVLRSSSLRTYAPYLCTVNSMALTIGNMTCPPKTLLCTVAFRWLIGESVMPYEYTIHLRYRSNKVTDNSGSTPATRELGWNLAVVDAGMREIDFDTGELKLITVPSKESGQDAAVTSPELLDGQGHAISPTAQRVPTLLYFTAYPAVEFPAWFYSEPSA